MIHRPAFSRAVSLSGARLVSGFRRVGLASPLLALLALACSAPPGAEDDGDDLPEFGGVPGVGGATSTPLPGNTGGSTQTPGNQTPGNEQNPGNLPVASNGGTGSGVSSGNGSGGTGNTGVAGSAGAPGAGGSAMTGGVGGSGMVGTAGNGSMPNPGGAGGAGGAGGTGNQEPPPQVLPGGFYLIDDFEGGRDPAWTESRVGGNASVIAVDTTIGANGSSSSLRVDSNNVFHTMLQFALPQAVRDANEVFGRVYIRLPVTPSAAHFIWVEVGNTQNDQHEMRLGHNVGQLQSNHFLNGEQDIRDQSRSLVANQWYCLEFQMANNPDEMRVWLDGQETALSTTNYTAGAGAQGNGNPVADFIPPLEAFRIGWELQNGTVFFDDVALANARIGCE
ncbi:MAG TPA: hypothetical protein VMG12_14180 [Polyangiaceae bacterium]|nr:hypothetical protein [Polyangiaceae bacterium]